MAPVNYTLAQISAALRTQWGGADNGTTRSWSGTTVSYSVPDTAPTLAGGESAGYRTMDLTEKSYTRLAFELWDDLIAINLDEVTGNDAQITVAMSSSTTNGGTYATPFLVPQPPGSSTFEREMQNSRIWLNTGWTDFQSGNWQYGERGLETILHEIGHALGLSHPGPYDASDSPAPTYADDALYTQDTLQWTIMSYWAAGSDGTAVDRTGTAQTRDANGDGVNAATPLLHDIMAIQAKYGADYTTRAGNDTYGFNVSLSGTYRPVFDFGWLWNPNPVIAIWDGGGVDMLDCSGYTQNQRIDLNPGAISDVGALTQNVAIAYNCWIENAAGGSGNDWLRGNAVGNHLWGNAGRDTIEGFDGNDTLDPGTGNEGSFLYGGHGGDTLWAGSGADYVDGGTGFDMADYSRSNAAVIIDFAAGKVTGGWATNDTLLDIEYLTGSGFDDSLGGHDGANYLVGGGGNDLIGGAGGSDTLSGGDGNDWLAGGAGTDTLYGGAGHDVAAFTNAVSLNLATLVHGGEAAGDVFSSIEEFRGGIGSDTMVAGAGAVRFAGGDGIDYLYGGSGGDWLQGGKGADYINGGAGFDIVSYADATNGITADLTLKSDVSEGKITAGDWGYDSLVGIEDVEGTAYADTFYGDDRSNKFVGLGGDDAFRGGAGADIFEGGAGNDSFVVNHLDFADGGAGIDSVSFEAGPVSLNFVTSSLSAGGAFFTLVGMEVFNGSDSGDYFNGGAAGETIVYGAGNDSIYGNGGNDFLHTGAGADIMDGGAGFDTIVLSRAMVADWQAGVLDAEIATDAFVAWEAMQGSAGDDRIRTNSWGYSVHLYGGGGNDTLATGVTGVVADVLRGEGGNDILDGGAGNDQLEGGDGNDTLVAGPGADVMDGGAGFDTIRLTGPAVADWQSGILDPNIATDTFIAWEAIEGSSGADVIRTNSWGYAVTLIGGLGNDLLAAGASGVMADTLVGGAGSDTLNGGAGNDSLDGGAGIDSMVGGLGDDTYRVNHANDRIVEAGGGGRDRVESSLADYTLGAGVEDLTLTGAARTGTGNQLANIVTGNGAANTLDGASGNDRLFGGAGNDLLLGGLGRDALFGEAGADTLDGGADADTLDGGANADVLTGGAAADRYVFAGAWGVDTISDFEDGLDIIDLRGLRGVNGGSPVAFAELLVVQSGTTASIRLDLDRNRAVDQIDLNGDGTPDPVRIDLLATAIAELSAADFLF